MRDGDSGGSWRSSANGLLLPATLDQKSDSGPVRAAVPDLTPYIVGAIPVIVPLSTIVVLGDPAVLRVLLARGNLAALFIGMLQPFLPIIIGSVVFVIIYRFTGRERFRAAAVPALATAGLLLIFTPISAAITEFGLLAAFLTVLWPRRRRRTFTIVAVVVVLGASGAGISLWGTTHDKPWALQQLITGRTLYALPREVGVTKDGTVRTHYLVAADDRITTVITGSPAEVHNLKTADIALRLPCRHRESGVERSLASLLFGPQRGGTAYCEDLSACLASLPQASARVDNAIADRCVAQSARRP